MTKKIQSAFEQALMAAALSRYQRILDSDTSTVQLSDAYQDYVARLMNKSSRKTWKCVNTAWKRVLIAVILAVLLAATAFAAIPALREGLIRFFVHDDGIALTFAFSQEDLERAPKEIERYYAPAYIPNQYELVSEKYLPFVEHRIYSDESGNVFDFSQYTLQQFEAEPDSPGSVSTHFSVSSKNVVAETVILRGYKVKIIRFQIDAPNNTEDIEILWTDHEYFYAIGCPAISIEEIDRIIGSMAPVEPNLSESESVG